MTGLKNNITLSSGKDWTKVIAVFIEFTCIYYGLFLVVIGCVCNSLSFIVLSRRAFRSTNTNISFYLRILSASDLGNLLNLFCSFSLRKALGVDILVACQVSRFTALFFLLLSSWILVIVAVERVLSIHSPLRHRTLCSGVVVKGVLTAALVFFGLISLLPALTYEDTVVLNTMTNTSTVIRCQPSIKDSSLNLGLYLSILIMVLFAILPSLLLVVLKIFIIVGVVRSRKTLMRKAVVTAGLSTVSTVTSTQRNTFRSSGQTRITRQEVSLTKTVLAINITFIMCNFPACAFAASNFYLTNDTALIGPLNDLSILLLYTNNAMNFVLYCVTGTKFKSEVKAFFSDIIHCRCPI